MLHNDVRRFPLFAAALSLAALTTMTPDIHAAAPQSAVPMKPPVYGSKQLPPPGIAIPEADRAELSAGVEALGKEIDSLRKELAEKPELLRYLPDVQIYYNAVHYALNWNEFYNAKEVAAAKNFLNLGMERAKSLHAGDAPWTRQTGIVALGYVSRIDGSVQPYGLLVPYEWSKTDLTPRRLDIFCHGRGDAMTEIVFLSGNGMPTSRPEFKPAGGFVVHPYGRFCNASRFAGEVDVFEALDDIKSRYPIDSDRVAMLGFSMGGASSWQFATHHADQWVAASPGAGFTETANYTKAFEPGKTPPPWYEQTLWHLYNPVDYAVNLAQCPTIGYSGEIDPQKQAADNMEAAMAKEGLKLTRSIGPQTKHAYHPESKKEISAFIDAAVAKGRNRKPDHIRFTTFTLRYNHMDWLSVEGMERHWERARVDATLTDSAAREVTIKTENVTRLWLDPRILGGTAVAIIDGQAKQVGETFVKTGSKWHALRSREDNRGLRKMHGLQGPIDDAFMDRFVMVRPSGTPQNAALGSWVQSEMAHAVHRWQTIFRADPPMVDDTAISKDQIANANLILWGDPSSNAVLAKIADKLPIRWAKDGSVAVGGKTYPAGMSVPVMVYPNPLNPSRYVVINSGLTWRESSNSTNAQQTPKLPDWAVIDITTPPNEYTAGKVVDAGFFDEAWKLQPGPPEK